MKRTSACGESDCKALVLGEASPVPADGNPGKEACYTRFQRLIGFKDLVQWGCMFRDAPDTFNFLRHVMRAIWSVRPKCSHRCVSLKETALKPVQILKHTTFYSAEQTAMRTKWFKHIAI